MHYTLIYMDEQGFEATLQEFWELLWRDARLYLWKCSLKKVTKNRAREWERKG